MVSIKDITDDVSKTKYANLIDKVAVPGYVNSAIVETKESIKHLAPRAFADSIECKLPINTKASCWTSALYLYGNLENIASPRYRQTTNNLTKHAELWGIQEDVELIKQAFAPQNIDTEYALSLNYRGEEIERCPCHTPELAKQSCSWLCDHKNHFPIAAQIKAAKNLIEKVGFSNLPEGTQDYIGSLAEADSFATAPNISLSNAITERLNTVKRSRWGDLGEELLKVSEDLQKDPYKLSENSQTLQTALETFDTQFGLQQKWGSGITHPVEACYSITRDKAAAAVSGTVKLMNGNYFDLNTATPSDLETGLKMAGDDFLNYAKPDGINLDIAKVKEILPTIPAPDANKFQRAFSSKQASTADYLKAMAMGAGIGGGAGTLYGRWEGGQNVAPSRMEELIEGFEGSGAQLLEVIKKYAPTGIQETMDSNPILSNLQSLSGLITGPALEAVKNELRRRAVSEGQRAGMWEGGTLGTLAGMLGGATYQGLNDLLFEGGEELPSPA